MNSPRKGSPTRINIHAEMDDFYTIMGDFYAKDSTCQRHESPTKRLIQQKNAAWSHKQVFKDKVRANQSYQLHYTTSPEKSHLIEPIGGELNYDLARKNPMAFYNNVMNQDIVQHKIKG
jgi:hypothetical protein